jgi:predicted dithiol-disulfide oxidoreductase (DUF899 family)
VVRKTSGQAVAGIAAAARSSIAAGRTARLTGALAVTLGVAAACWVIAIQRMSGMDMGVSTRLGSFGSFTVLWLVMMAAMMLPGAAPAAVRRARASGRLLAAPLFAGSYLGVWALAGVVVYALYRPHGTVAAGAAAIVAGIYEFTPLKAALPPPLPRQCPLRIPVRAVLHRIVHRADGDDGGTGHEHHLDGSDRGARPGSEAASRDTSSARWPGQAAVTTRIRRNKEMTSHKIGTREQWAAAREQLLAREKEHTRLGDELARQRRELPWVRVDKEYCFDTGEGTRTLAELFDGRSQLLIYHFMFGPSYAAGCPTCSSIADSVNGILPHLNARDVTMLFVSQAPLETLQAFKQRMGWSFPWVSSANSEFNTDLGFSSSQEQTREWAEPMLEQLPPIAARNARETGTDLVGYLTENFGFSVFVLDDGDVYHTYSTGGRGVEFLMGYYPILDRAPKGRDEGDGFQLWIRRHDEYDSQ